MTTEQDQRAKYVFNVINGTLFASAVAFTVSTSTDPRIYTGILAASMALATAEQEYKNKDKKD